MPFIHNFPWHHCNQRVHKDWHLCKITASPSIAELAAIKDMSPTNNLMSPSLLPRLSSSIRSVGLWVGKRSLYTLFWGHYITPYIPRAPVNCSAPLLLWHHFLYIVGCGQRRLLLVLSSSWALALALLIDTWCRTLPEPYPTLPMFGKHGLSLSRGTRSG